jgi:hypothetical protein
LLLAGPLLQVLLLTFAQGLQHLPGLSGRQVHGLQALALGLKLQVIVRSGLGAGAALAGRGVGAASRGAGIEAALAAGRAASR